MCVKYVRKEKIETVSVQRVCSEKQESYVYSDAKAIKAEDDEKVPRSKPGVTSHIYVRWPSPISLAGASCWATLCRPALAKTVQPESEGSISIIP